MVIATALAHTAVIGCAGPPLRPIPSTAAPLDIPPLPPLPPTPKNVANAPADDARPVQPDRAHAQELFTEGRAAAAAGDLVRARDRFVESQRFDPAVGTLLNLASVEARMGDYLDARGHYQEAYDTATANGDTDRAAYAKAARDAIPP